MTERTLVIGSNRGIGLEICKQLLARGHEVHAACRNASEELFALGDCTVHEDVDVKDKASLDALADKFDDKSIDALWVVAGILERTDLESLDVRSIRRQFEVNALGPLLAVHALRGALRDGSKVGLLTSRMGSIEDNTSGSSYGYRMSKAALNMAGRSLSHDLRPRKIAVALLHPGYVRTDMTGHTGQIDPDTSAAGLLARMDTLSLESSGTFWHANGEALPW